MSKRTQHRIALGVLGVVMAGAAVAAAAMMFLSRGVLDGDSYHDFGVVRISDVGEQVQHVFHLTNRGQSPVRIEQVKTSCGCLAAKPSMDTVPPGATVDIPATLLIKSSIRKRATLTLVLGEEGVQTLTLEALGRREEPLFVRRPMLEVPAAGAASMNVYLEKEGADPPPTNMQVTATEGVAATLGAWIRSRAANAENEHPSIWLAPLEVLRTAEVLPADSIVTIRLDDERVVRIPLSPAPDSSKPPVSGD